jgi:hypothetical protein
MNYDDLIAFLKAVHDEKEAFAKHVLATGEGRTVFDPVHRCVILFRVGMENISYDWLSRN